MLSCFAIDILIIAGQLAGQLVPIHPQGRVAINMITSSHIAW